MGRPAKEVQVKEDPMSAVIARAHDENADSIADMPLNSLGDYMRYNAAARKANHKLRMRRYVIKPCPVDLHPKERIVFQRNDQPTNPLPVYLSNDMIEFSAKLVPGQTYELPRCIVDYLASKGNPVWAWYDNPDGSKETRIKQYDPRFSLRTIYKD